MNEENKCPAILNLRVVWPKESLQPYLTTLVLEWRDPEDDDFYCFIDGWDIDAEDACGIAVTTLAESWPGFREDLVARHVAEWDSDLRIWHVTLHTRQMPKARPARPSRRPKWGTVV